MADTPPTETFGFAYSLYFDGNQIKIDRRSFITNISVTDIQQTGDNLSVLGDIPNDSFHTDIGGGTSTGTGTYYGETTDANGIIYFVQSDTGGSYTLLSDKGDYTSGQALNFNRQAYALCFVSKTNLRTARGEVAVESLRVGDMAVTASGALRPVTWIGRRDLDSLRFNQQPIRIRAGAFGPSTPARDLRLSPGHPVLIGDVLVPIMCLINGTSIAREPVSAVTYWHVELDAHDILLAEGLPAESYYDMGSRAWFSGEDGRLIDPEFVPAGLHGRCRRVAVDGPVVEAERARIDAVFAAELASHAGWHAADAWCSSPA